jgi:hypothetical protein
MTTRETTHTTTTRSGATAHHWLHRSSGAEVNGAPAWMLADEYVSIDSDGVANREWDFADLDVDIELPITSPELAAAVARHLGTNDVSFGSGFSGDDPFGGVYHPIEAS